MPWTLASPPEDALVRWIEDSLATGTNRLAHGYQGAVYLYPGMPRLVVKAATCVGVMRWLRRRMLRREYAVYQKLDGFRGSPRCYGLLADRYLFLEYIEAAPLRQAVLTHLPSFFSPLFQHINSLHARGIGAFRSQEKEQSAGDLGGLPCLIDYGAAIIRKPGIAPLNHYLYVLAERFDFNAWVKLKIRRQVRASVTPTVYIAAPFGEGGGAIKRLYKCLKSAALWKAR